MVEHRTGAAGAQTNKKLVLVTMGSVLLIVMIGFINLLERESPKSISANSQLTEDIYQHYPRLGSGDAPVKMIEFADFKCTSCKKWNSDIFPRLKEEYVLSGKLDFYFGNMPILSEDSLTAALAAESVYRQKPDLYWKYETLLYENLNDKTIKWDTEQLIQIAKSNSLPIDLNQLKNDIENQTYKEQVAMQKMIGQNAGVTRVPAIYLNGKPVSGDYDALKKMIEVEIEKKKEGE